MGPGSASLYKSTLLSEGAALIVPCLFLGVSIIRVSTVLYRPNRSRNVIILILFLVADTPENLAYERLNSGLAHIQLSWTGTSFKYLVEIRNDNSEKSFKYMVSRNDSNDTSVTTMLNVTDNLDINETYSVSVIAVGDSMKNELPSNETEDIIIFLGKIQQYRIYNYYISFSLLLN